MKDLFFNKLIQTFLQMEQNPSLEPILKSSAFENYPDWYEHYRDDFSFLPEELPEEETYIHWRKWSMAFLEKVKNNENLIKFSNSGIILYRALLLHGAEKIKFDNLGECWSIYPHTKVIFDDNAEDGAEHHITLTAEVPIDSIDFEAVVEFFTNLYAFNEEGEVRLFKGSFVHLIQVGNEIVDKQGII